MKFAMSDAENQNSPLAFNIDLDGFLDSLKATYKQDQIITSGSDFELLNKDPVTNSKEPIAYIYPESADQVQVLVKTAGQFNIKLWVYSTGKNWGYLNTSGSENAVVVLLNRMNKIIHVDAELDYAIIQPGVTFQALNTFLKEHNYALWTDSPGGPPTGSVIGNALDRGVGVTKYSEHYAHLCGYEVVLADGSVINTGVANNQGSQGAAHLYKWGVGPFVEGLFSQSNFGIVTHAGIWLMRKPEDYYIFSFSIKDNAALASCMDAVRELILDGVIHESGRFSNDMSILTLLTQAVDEGFEPRQTISKAEFAKLKEKYYIPAWTGSFGLYGQTPIVKAAAKIVKTKLKQSNSCVQINQFSQKRANQIRKAIDFVAKSSSEPFVNLVDWISRKVLGTSLPLLRLFPAVVDLHEGIPVESVVRRAYFRSVKKCPEKDLHIGRDELGILWSVPILPFKGQENIEFAEKCQALFEQYGFDFFMSTFIFNARSVCPLMLIFYDRLDSEACDKAEKLYLALLSLSHQLGYQHYRAGVNGWNKLYENCPELKILNQKIKEALDPQGIFAPGRYGID